MNKKGPAESRPQPSPGARGEARPDGAGAAASHSGRGDLANAFAKEFLHRLDFAEEPESAPEADLAGPWTVLPISWIGGALRREDAGPRPHSRPSQAAASASHPGSVTGPQAAETAAHAYEPEASPAAREPAGRVAATGRGSSDGDEEEKEEAAGGGSELHAGRGETGETIEDDEPREDAGDPEAPEELAGFAVLRQWESPEHGDRPYAVFRRRETALLAAAVLPGTGRDPCFRLLAEPGPEGFAIDSNGLPSGHVGEFDENLVTALNVASTLIRSPESLACLLEAAGHLSLQQAGKILARRVALPDRGQS